MFGVFETAVHLNQMNESALILAILKQKHTCIIIKIKGDLWLK